MFRGVILHFKRSQLSKTLRSIESIASERKSWGNSLSTIVITTKLILMNIDDLFDQDKFLQRNSNISIKSYFSSIQAMVDWVKEVSLIVSDITNERASDIPQSRQWVVVNDVSDVNVYQYICGTEDRAPDIRVLYSKMSKSMKLIEKNLVLLTPNMRTYLDMRLVNGFNTLLIFNELILGAMINGK